MKKREYKSALARSGTTLMSTPERMKYADDQPRDDAGRWSASGASSSPQGEGHFAKPEGSSKLDENNRAHWSNTAGGHFAQGYVAATRESMGKAGPKDTRIAEQFRKDFSVTSQRHGFAGSGHADYKHNETGAQFHVERMATGKNFYDTAHLITAMPSEAKKYDDSETRDDTGRWSGSGAGGQLGNLLGQGKNPRSPLQTNTDRSLLQQTGHPQGPQYIGPRQVRNCTNYDEHRQDFYRDRGGAWNCPHDQSEDRPTMVQAAVTDMKRGLPQGTTYMRTRKD